MLTPEHISCGSESERLTKVAPRKHSIYTHFPTDWNCDVCVRTKITRAPSRRRTGEAVPRAEKFDDLITADHKVPRKESESRNNHQYAVVVRALATPWLHSFPCKTKTSQETQKSLRKFLEPSEKPKVIYSDNSMELGKACEDSSWNHRTSTPHRSGTTGIAERAVRRTKEGTSAVLLQSGLDEKWWADSTECHCHLRNVQDHQADGKTLENHLTDQLSRLEQWWNIIRFLHETSRGSTNLVRRSCQEYSSDTHWLREESGREIYWLQLGKLDASELHGRVRNAKERITSKKFSQSQTARQNC